LLTLAFSSWARGLQMLSRARRVQKGDLLHEVCALKKMGSAKKWGQSTFSNEKMGSEYFFRPFAAY
jgi:hypothetical protein